MSEVVEDGPPPITEASRARVALSAEAARVSDAAAAFVPVHPGEMDPSGAAGAVSTEWVAEADVLLSAARRLLEAAVVFAKVGGRSWAQVGSALGVTAQSAQERFKPAVREFVDSGVEQSAAATGTGFGDPEAVARELDGWVSARPREVGGPDPGAAAVSGQLARMTPQAELRWLSDLLFLLWGKDHARPVSREATMRITARQVALWEQIAAAEPRPSRATREGLAHARLTHARLITDTAPESAPESAGDPR